MYHFIPNYNEHPTNPYYLIFTFRVKEMADHFEKELTDNNIQFESSENLNKEKKMHYFYAVKQSDRKEAIKINSSTWANFRKPIFSNPIVKLILAVILVIFIVFVVLGYINK